MTAVQQKGKALFRASANMQNNKGIVMTAVQQNGIALRHASANMQNTEDIVLHAVCQRPTALEFASERLKEKIQQAACAWGIEPQLYARGKLHGFGIQIEMSTERCSQNLIINCLDLSGSNRATLI